MDKEAFWITQLSARLNRLLSIATGDGEVLAVLQRQEALAQIHF